MLSFTRYPKLDFTWFISEGETTTENWFQTVSSYRKEGVTTFELYDLRQQTNLFSVEEIEMILHYTHNSESSRPSNTTAINRKTSVVKHEIINVRQTRDKYSKSTPAQEYQKRIITLQFA
jgi:hypothetical protein